MYNYVNQEAFLIKNEKNDDAVSKIKKNLFTPDVAFTNGTIFKCLYEPYKNYKVAFCVYFAVTNNEY